MSGKKGEKASAEDLHVMDTVEQYETYEDYLDSQVDLGEAMVSVRAGREGGAFRGGRCVVCVLVPCHHLSGTAAAEHLCLQSCKGP